MFLRNARILVPGRTASDVRRPQYGYSASWKPQIVCCVRFHIGGNGKKRAKPTRIADFLTKNQKRNRISYNSVTALRFCFFHCDHLWLLILRLLADVEEPAERERILVIAVLIGGGTLLQEALEKLPMILSLNSNHYQCKTFAGVGTCWWLRDARAHGCVCVCVCVCVCGGTSCARFYVLSVSNCRARYESNLSVQKRHGGRQ